MIDDLELGKAGEHLVCADLILKGYKAYLSDQGLPYDVVCDIGNRLIRIQVKTTAHTVIRQEERKTAGYMFTLKLVGKNKNGIFQNDKVDLFALVATDESNIAYLLPSETKRTISVRAEKYRGSYTGESGKDGRGGVYLSDFPFSRIISLFDRT
jgi:PD-(D/E)XK nuclease superfamily protein